MTGPVSTQGLAQLHGAVDAAELIRRRRDELTVVRAELEATVKRIRDRDREMERDRLALGRLQHREGQLAGWLEARRLNGDGR